MFQEFARKAASPLIAFVLALVGLSVPCQASGSPSMADLRVSDLSAEWTPLVEADLWILRIATPTGPVIERHFPRGLRPTVVFEDRVAWSDGVYIWELIGLLLSGPARTESGAFWILGGSGVPNGLRDDEVSTLRRIAAPGVSRVIGADQQIGDDLIVSGNACVGVDCVNGEPFDPVGGYDTLWLKENVVRLKFDDTSTGGGLPANDWQVTVNDPLTGGANKFAIEDLTGVKKPFTIFAGTQDNTLVLTSGTNPFGKVGIGTATPTGRFHIYGPENADVFAGMGVDLAAGPALNFGYAGGSFGIGVGFFNVRPAAGATGPNPSLRFSTVNVQRVIIDKDGNIGIGIDVSSFDPSAPIHHTSGAQLTSGGQWNPSSSRTHKHDIRPLGRGEAEAAFAKLEAVRFRYNEEPEEEYLGFIAEDVPALVATNGRSTLSPMDLIALLTKVVQDQQATVRKQEARLRDLASKVEKLSQRGDKAQD